MDVWSCTFECGAYCGSNRGSTLGDRSRGLEKLRASLRYLDRHARLETLPSIVLFENSSELGRLHAGAEGEVDAMLLARAQYAWHKGTLCPTTHSNCPNARLRIYWVGLRKAIG